MQKAMISGILATGVAVGALGFGGAYVLSNADAPSAKPVSVEPIKQVNQVTKVKPPVDKPAPEVTPTLDTVKAGKQLDKLRKSGKWNPNKIEYADDAVISLLQYKYWSEKGYIAKDGSWSAKAKKTKGWMDGGYDQGKVYKKYMKKNSR